MPRQIFIPKMLKKNELFEECVGIFINLLKTTMGTGILAYPSIFRICGIPKGILLTAASALASLFGLWLYIDLNSYYGLDNTMSSLSYYILPQMKSIVDLIVIMKCFSVFVAYLFLLKHRIPQVTALVFDAPKDATLCLFMILLLTSPFIFMFRLNRLKYTSSLGLVATFMLVAFSIYRYCNFSNIAPPGVRGPKDSSYLPLLGPFTFSFTCHQNIFTVQNEMRISNKLALKLTTLLVFVAASVMYIVFGVATYLTFRESTPDNFFETLSGDNMSSFVLVFYFLVVMMSIPLQTHPCRMYVLNMIDQKYSTQEKHWEIRSLASFIIISSAFLLSLRETDYNELCRGIGSTFSALMCFVFASFYYFIAFRGTGFEMRKIMALYSIAYGGLAILSFFYRP
jgi:amino acid permease